VSEPKPVTQHSTTAEIAWHAIEQTCHLTSAIAILARSASNPLALAELAERASRIRDELLGVANGPIMAVVKRRMKDRQKREKAAAKPKPPPKGKTCRECGISREVREIRCPVCKSTEVVK
jgi:hypothetical protein